MMKTLKNIFKGKKTKGPEEYKGLSDFLMHAPSDEQKRVFTEAASKANDDQMKVFKQAQGVEA